MFFDKEWQLRMKYLSILYISEERNILGINLKLVFELSKHRRGKRSNMTSSILQNMIEACFYLSSCTFGLLVHVFLLFETYQIFGEIVNVFVGFQLMYVLNKAYLKVCLSCIFCWNFIKSWLGVVFLVF